jgi:hypothetical protein
MKIVYINYLNNALVAKLFENTNHKQDVESIVPGFIKKKQGIFRIRIKES